MNPETRILELESEIARLTRNKRRDKHVLAKMLRLNGELDQLKLQKSLEKFRP